MKIDPIALKGSPSGWYPDSRSYRQINLAIAQFNQPMASGLAFPRPAFASGCSDVARFARPYGLWHPDETAERSPLTVAAPCGLCTRFP